MHKTKVSEKHTSDHSRKRFERKRYLNVIYFIDSNRTRTLKFSIGTSYLTVGLLTVAVVWSVVATALLVRDRFVIAEMSAHSKSLLDTVFNYQTRYDEVYERAYPNPIDPTQAIAEEETPRAIETPKSIENSKTKKKETTTFAAQTSVLPVDETAIAKDKANAPGFPATELPIAIDNFASTLLGKSLTIRLSLKNLNSPAKSSGSISGIGKFVDSNNQTHMIVGRPSRSGDEAEHFNIRYFKNKNLVFEAPKDLAGKFTTVTVTIQNETGVSKEFPYSINKDVPLHVAAPAPVAAATRDNRPAEPQSEAPLGSESSAPALKAADAPPSAEQHTDAVDTSLTSGETETTNDASN